MIICFSYCTNGKFECVGEICNGTLECAENKFACLDESRCIYDAHVCDGVVDCIDSSDEYNCSMYYTYAVTIWRQRLH